LSDVKLNRRRSPPGKIFAVAFYLVISRILELSAETFVSNVQALAAANTFTGSQLQVRT